MHPPPRSGGKGTIRSSRSERRMVERASVLGASSSVQNKRRGPRPAHRARARSPLVTSLCRHRIILRLRWRARDRDPRGHQARGGAWVIACRSIEPEQSLGPPASPLAQGRDQMDAIVSVSMFQGSLGCWRASERREFASFAPAQVSRHLAERLKKLAPRVVAIEATGGFETVVAAGLAAAALPVLWSIRRRCAPLPRRSANGPRPTRSTRR